MVCTKHSLHTYNTAFLNDCVKLIVEWFNAWLNLSHKIRQSVRGWTILMSVQKELFSTGRSPTFTNWSKGQPDNRGNQDCACNYYNRKTGAWDDVTCSYKLGLICEISGRLIILSKNFTSQFFFCVHQLIWHVFLFLDSWGCLWNPFVFHICIKWKSNGSEMNE